MGSVIDYIECPDCGSEAYDEFMYKTGEEFTTCMHCGYTRKFYITNWEDQDKESEFEWVPDYKLVEEHGCGAYKIRYYNDLGYQCGGFIEQASEQEFLRLVEENKANLAHAEYSTFIDGVLSKHILIMEEGFDLPDINEDKDESI